VVAFSALQRFVGKPIAIRDALEPMLMAAPGPSRSRSKRRHVRTRTKAGAAPWRIRRSTDPRGWAVFQIWLRRRGFTLSSLLVAAARKFRGCEPIGARTQLIGHGPAYGHQWPPRRWRVRGPRTVLLTSKLHQVARDAATPAPRPGPLLQRPPSADEAALRGFLIRVEARPGR
jgi:hypothetical protein